METSLIKDRDFIIFGLQSWDIPIGSNCKNIAVEIVKNNRVLYVNRPLDRISNFKAVNDIQTINRKESVKRGKNIIKEVKNNLWVFNPRIIVESINFLPTGFLYDFLNRRNNKKLASEINWAKEKLKFKNPILIVDNDFYNGLYLKDFLKPTLFIYYIRDFLLSQNYFIRHGNKAESLIIKKADGIAANSKYLSDYAANTNPNVSDVGQGCDVEDYLAEQSEIPPDIANINYPIIGYCGSLTVTRLDIDLLYFIAAQKPLWNIVFVGPEDDEFKLSELHKLKNVHFLGPKITSQLPKYTHAFNVCINPQLLNQMTIGNYPRKVDEYLAAGKPVVATKTNAMEMFRTEVYLCTDKNEFIEKIKEALNEVWDENKKEARKKLAKSHTWAASVNKIYQLIIKTDKTYEGC